MLSPVGNSLMVIHQAVLPKRKKPARKQAFINLCKKKLEQLMRFYGSQQFVSLIEDTL
jgi:hypothetical protein